ncbi:MAG TPA: hypothetical protein VMS32_10325 [Verrucomicrobiae bacterium]|nr:hypothetical protein [Verrucomicrobiae bacterium]
MSYNLKVALALLILCCFALPVLSGVGVLESPVSLDSGMLRLKIPTRVTVTKKRINFETDYYTILRKADGKELLGITVGGGAYDLRGYRSICLNHRRGWRLKAAHALSVVVGDPGVNAVNFAYENLSTRDANIADGIIASAQVLDAPYCRD